ncbi:hypothetical protein FACS1894193_00240 [Bacilli bacterium]|nr:hypothetical protein FACS1894193_00240 [Bacilli bacterium]
MANITFLIGNGLDIKLGLKTSYSDFYNSLSYNSKNEIIKNIKNEPETWSDFETAFGKFAKQSEDAETTMDAHDEITELLNDYLKKQDEFFNLESKNNSDKLTDDVIHNTLKSIERDFIQNNHNENQSANSQIHNILKVRSQNQYFFINFNYTTTLTKLINRYKEYENSYSPKLLGHDSDFKIHGTLDNKVTLGVNHRDDIANPLFENQYTFCVKPECLENMNDGRVEEAENLIDSSHIIVIFGMSIGPSDKKWWDKILRHLEYNLDSILVIHDYYVGGISATVPRKLAKIQNEIKNRILRYYEGEGKEDISRRIFPVINSEHIFHFEE